MPSVLRSMMFVLLASVPVIVTATPQAPEPVASVQAVASNKVKLNHADADTLQRELTGIGMAKAEAIVAHREANGVFTSVDELLEVKGIGKSLLDKNRERLAVE